MLKDVTLGQYYRANSVIHALDPRTKLAGTLLFLIALFINHEIVGCLFSALVLYLFVRLSKIPVAYILRGLKSVIFLVVLSVIMNLFMTEGGVVLWSFWKLKITSAGVLKTLFMVARIIMLIMASSLMTLTTTPNDLTDGLERGLGFLTVVKIPVHSLAMMMSIALRFIPILTEEAEKIMKAQMARGADFTEGGIIRRAKGLIPLFVPLLLSAFRRAADLANAMDARCYTDGKGRTKLHPLQYKRRDFIAYLVLFGFLSATIAIAIVRKG